MLMLKEKTEEERGVRINHLPVFEKEDKRQVNLFVEALAVAFAKSLNKEENEENAL